MDPLVTLDTALVDAMELMGAGNWVLRRRPTRFRELVTPQGTSVVQLWYVEPGQLHIT